MKKLLFTFLFLLEINTIKIIASQTNPVIPNPKPNEQGTIIDKILSFKDKIWKPLSFKDKTKEFLNFLGILVTAGMMTLYVSYFLYNFVFRKYAWNTKGGQYSNTPNIGWPLTKKLLNFFKKVDKRFT